MSYLTLGLLSNIKARRAEKGATAAGQLEGSIADSTELRLCRAALAWLA
jgi:hypothetical protein